MTHNPTTHEQSSIPLLLLYTAIATLGSYLDYLAGSRIEAAFGPQVSLVFFLSIFVALVILAFPVSLLILGIRKRELAS